MFCHACGNEIAEGTTVCPKCGAKIGVTEGNNSSNVSIPTNTDGTQEPKIENAKVAGTAIGKEKLSKHKLVIAITNIALGAILLLLSLDSDYDWTIAPFFLGIGICVSGILQILQVSPKIIAIVQVVMGAIAVSNSVELANDWEYVGFVAGVGLLVCGILSIRKISCKVISIVEIVFGGVTLLWGFAFIDWAWGDTGLIFGAAFLVEGILNLVNIKKNTH